MGTEVSIEASEDAFQGVNATRKSIYHEQIMELAEIRQPSYSEEQLVVLANELQAQLPPVYVHIPWKAVILETVPEAAFYEIKTNRNQLLITADEQSKLYGSKFSFAGMSVGSSLLYGMVGSGFGSRMHIADDDVFSNSNLNRVQATILDVGEPKVAVAHQRALEMNPFLNVTSFTDRIDTDNASAFLFDGDCSIVFEEIDDFRMKVLLREEAKRLGVPLVMLTNLGDNVMIDVERYDTQPDTKPFNGYVDEALLEKIKATDEVDQDMMKQLSVSLVDRSLVPDRAIESVQKIGQSLVGRPQLFGTVATGGGLAPYIARKILLEDSLASGRYSLRIGGFHA